MGEKHREAALKRWQNPEYREKLKGRGEAISKGLKKAYEDPLLREQASDSRKKWITENPESMSEAVRKGHLSRDPESGVKLAANARKTRCVFPNKLEKYVHTLLGEDWKYVGNGSLLIGKLNPDFVHVTDKKVVEVYGDYWHAGQDPNDRINAFKDLGYQCIVIWEHEVKVPGRLNKLLEGMEKKNVPERNFEIE